MILDSLFGPLYCWLGYHAWEPPPDLAEQTIATLLGYAARCRRCGAEQEVNRDL